MTDILDRLIAQEIVRFESAKGAGRCSCARCLAGPLNWAEAPRPRPAPGATRSGTGGSALPRWRGWTGTVTLGELNQAWTDRIRRRTPIPRTLAPFFRTGTPNLYRITRAGIDRNRPLTIGMTERNKSIRQRVHEHHGTQAGDPNVKAKLASFDERRILVQAGLLSGRPDIRQAHGYEIWLQGRERPLIYQPDTRPFDEAHW